mgnify:CR=1 FL=1
MMVSRPAAFGRLCVETFELPSSYPTKQPAAFGRLCVETINQAENHSVRHPAAFGRLCVETAVLIFNANFSIASRLRAAVC